MDNIKPWQIVLFVVAVGVLGFSIWRYGFGNSLEAQMANSMYLLDAQSGQIYLVDLSRGRGVLIPARRPETGEIALLPIYEKDGSWYITEHYRNALDQLDVPQDAIPNPNSPVKVNGGAPIKYSR